MLRIQKKLGETISTACDKIIQSDDRWFQLEVEKLDHIIGVDLTMIVLEYLLPYHAEGENKPFFI